MRVVGIGIQRVPGPTLGRCFHWLAINPAGKLAARAHRPDVSFPIVELALRAPVRHFPP